jgi:hypothetical protein
LTEADPSDIDRPPRRFPVELFIVDPTMEPVAIATALRLEAQNTRRVGDHASIALALIMPLATEAMATVMPLGDPFPGIASTRAWSRSLVS